MAVRIVEKPRSQAAVRDLKNPSSKREFACSGSFEKNDILLALALYPGIGVDVILAADASSPSDVINVFAKRVEVKEFGGGCWDAVVSYEGSADITEVSFNVGVSSGKIFEALTNHGRRGSLA